MNPDPGGPIRTILVSLLGAVTLTLGVFLARQRRGQGSGDERRGPAGETSARTFPLERLRELGF